MLESEQMAVVAWEVSLTCDDLGAEVVFAVSEEQAILIGCQELNADEDCIDVVRQPEYDKYAGAGRVPRKVLIEAGWQMECWHCGSALYSDDSDGVGLDTIIESGIAVYCNAAHKAARDKEISDRNAAFDDFKRRIIKIRPDLTFIRFSGGFGWGSMEAAFSFPGAKYGGRVLDQKADGDLVWSVAQGDMDAWLAYEAQPGDSYAS